MGSKPVRGHSRAIAGWYKSPSLIQLQEKEPYEILRPIRELLLTGISNLQWLYGSVGLKKLIKTEKKNSILAEKVSKKSSVFPILNCVSH